MHDLHDKKVIWVHWTRKIGYVQSFGVLLSKLLILNILLEERHTYCGSVTVLAFVNIFNEGRDKLLLQKRMATWSWFIEAAKTTTDGIKKTMGTSKWTRKFAFHKIGMGLVRGSNKDWRYTIILSTESRQYRRANHWRLDSQSELSIYHGTYFRVAA